MPRLRKKVFYSIVISLILLVAAMYWTARSYVSLPIFARAAAADIASLNLPPGYEMIYFAPPNSGLHAPRQLAAGEDGWIFAGSYGDKVYALRDENEDGVADDIRVVAAGMNKPRGVAFADGDLYIGAVDAVYVVRDVGAKLADGGEIRPRMFIGGLVNNAWHGARYLKIGADKMLYVSLGVPCNICIPPDPEMTGVIRRYPLPRGGAGEVFARGIRNSVGFDFYPGDGALWFTDNGRDWLGDDQPSDELNRAPRAGMHFGFPHCHQGDLPDPEFGGEIGCENAEPPVLKTGAHVANLGMTFDAAGEYAYIALHGSWNRSVKTGYAVWRAAVRKDGAVSEYAPFAEGWLSADESVAGRPADVMFAGGDLLVSDDFANVIYRARKIR